MKTPETRSRFQTATRHYHRYRPDNRGWEDWIDRPSKPSPWKRALWISATVVLASAGVALLFVFDVI
jgi:hypothetical protein